ncbi:MAG: nucleotidyltransferase domain-containing protein [Arenicellales bacterium]
MSQLADALFTTTQQKVLGLIYSQPDKSFYLKEILRITGMGVHTIRRELDRMLAAGIVTMTKIGNQHHYQANTQCPIYSELISIVKKTFGIAGIIKSAFLKIKGHVDWLFIFGSVASGKESSNSDIDLLVVGDVKFSDVVSALYPAQEILGREINPKVYSKKEWKRLKNAKDSFVLEVLSKPKIDVVGEEQ